MKWISLFPCVLLLLLGGGCNSARQSEPIAGTPDEPISVSGAALRIRNSEGPTEYRNIHHVSRPVLLAGEGTFRTGLLSIPPDVELETAFGISGGRNARIKAQGGGPATGEPLPVVFDVCFQRLDDGSVVSVYLETLDAAPNRNQQWWVERRISLAPAAGSTGRLIFRIGAVPHGKSSGKDNQQPVPVWAESVLHPLPASARGKLILLVSADTCRADALGS